MKKTTSLALVAVLAMASPAFSETSEATPRKSGALTALSLTRSIELALAKNFTVQVEEISPQIRFEAITEEKGNFDPVLSTGFIRSRDENPQSVDPFTDLPGSSIEEDDILNFGVKGLFPWGASYDLSLRSDNRRGNFNDFEDEFTTFADFSIVQPILRNFGRRTSLSEIRIARRNHETSEWEFRQVLIDTIAETIFAYNDLYFSNETLEVALRTRDLAGRLLSDNKKRVQAGAMEPLGLLVAEAELALREESLISARRIQRDQQNRFKRLLSDEIIGLPKKEISILSPEPPEEFSVDVERDYETALEKRPDFHQAQLDLETRTILLARDRNLALPSLDFIGRYGLRGLDDSLLSSLDDLAKKNNQSFTVGAVLNLPFPNREGRSRKIAAYLARNQAGLSLKRLQQKILLDIDDAARRIQSDWERIGAAKKARRLSEKSLRAEGMKLRAGTSTTFVVLELQKDLANAQIRELSAVTDYNKAVAEYDRQLGRSLEKYHVIVSEPRSKVRLKQKARNLSGETANAASARITHASLPSGGEFESGMGPPEE